MPKTIGELKRGDSIFALNEINMTFTEFIVTNIYLGGIIRIDVKPTDEKLNSFLNSKSYFIMSIFRNRTTTLSVSTHNSQCAIREIINNRTAYEIRRANINKRRKCLLK